MYEVAIQYINIIIPILLLIVGYIAGSIAEKRHYGSIIRRERELQTLPAVTFRNMPDHDTANCMLVSGSAVISIDYFKRILAMLRNIFGGRVASYESLVDRARREALLRMKEEAKGMNADMVINVRIETSSIGQSANSGKQIGSVEAIAYGTALVPGGK